MACSRWGATGRPCRSTTSSAPLSPRRVGSMHHKSPAPSPACGSGRWPRTRGLLPRHNRRGHDVIPPAGAPAFPHRILGVGVEPPQEPGLAVGRRLGQEAVHPAVTAGENRLRLAAQHGESRRGPLPFQNIPARPVVGRDQLAGPLVQVDEAGGLRGRHTVVVGAVGRAHQQQIAGRRYRATAHVALGNAQLSTHVVAPHDVGLAGETPGFAGRRPSSPGRRCGWRSLPWPKIHHLAAIVDQPQPVPLDQRPAQMPCLGQSTAAPLGQLLRGILPEEPAVVLSEAQQATQVDFSRIAGQ